jgi:hypothetical protein
MSEIIPDLPEIVLPHLFGTMTEPGGRHAR